MKPYNSYKNRKVLVTGHTGFKGSWLSIWLRELGAHVVGFSLELLFYSKMFDDPIFFLENSGYDFSVDDEFEKLFSSRSIELLVFPRSVETTRGKRYQEFEMIETVLIFLEAFIYQLVIGKYIDCYMLQHHKRLEKKDFKDV